MPRYPLSEIAAEVERSAVSTAFEGRRLGGRVCRGYLVTSYSREELIPLLRQRFNYNYHRRQQSQQEPLEFMLGADPEFLFYRGNNFVPANSIFGRRSLRTQLGTDGVMNTGEMRPKPGDAANVYKNVDRLIGRLAKKGAGYNVYAGSGRAVPTGGHIHFSRNIPRDTNLLEALDKFIYAPLNSVSNTGTRRGYNVPSAYQRAKHGGWEYRSPLSWLAHPKLTKGALGIAQVLAGRALKGLGMPQDWEQLIKAAGNQREAITDFQNKIQEIQNSGTLLEEIEVIEAWGKKNSIDRRNSVTATIPRFKVAINRADAYLTDLPNFTSTRPMRIIGARQDRSEEATVFVSSNITSTQVAAINAAGAHLVGNSSFLEGVRRREELVIGLSYKFRELPDLEGRIRRIIAILEREN